MTGVEWNKKEELLQDQALRHLKQYLPLFAAFTNNFKSEINLLNKIQEYCYDNMNFLKTFNKIILLLYKSKLLLLQKLEERSLLIYSSKPFTFNLLVQSLKNFIIIFSWHFERGCNFEVVQGVSFPAGLVSLHGPNEKVHRVAGERRWR